MDDKQHVELYVTLEKACLLDYEVDNGPIDMEAVRKDALQQILKDGEKNLKEARPLAEYDIHIRAIKKGGVFITF